MKSKGHFLFKDTEFLDKPLYSLTVGEFFEALEYKIEETGKANNQPTDKPEVTDKYVHGLKGLAKLFGCSTRTAWQIKDSGRLNGAIKQIGNTIVTDAELAIRLAGEKQNPRKNGVIR